MADGMMGYDPTALLKMQIQREQEKMLMDEAKLSNPQFTNYMMGQAGRQIGQAVFGNNVQDPRLQQATALQQVQQQALQAGGGDASSAAYFKALATGFARMGMTDEATKAAKQAADLDKADKFGQGGYTATGFYRSKSGVVYSPTEMKTRRTELDTLEKGLRRLNEISGEDIKTAQFPTDLTKGISKSVAGTFSPKTLGAQTKIAAAAVQDILSNLPPGSASDADVRQAQSSFPGYADAEELAKWVNRTKDMLQFNLKRLSENYDFNPVVSSSGAITVPGAKPAAVQPSGVQSSAIPPRPKAGDVMAGYRFKGGDPSKKENWELVK